MSPSSRQRSMSVRVPSRREKGLEACAECRAMKPMPSLTRWQTLATTSSETSWCAMCPHQSRTSVLFRTSSVRPCSGSSSVAVRTVMSSFLERKSAMAPWMPLG